MNAEARSSKLKRLMADDSGIALAVVMFVSVILFILASAILLLVEYRSSQSQRIIQRDKAVHIADAGLNQYMYQLSKEYTFYSTEGTLGPVAVDGGSYTVVPSLNASGSLILTSVGTLTNGYSRTVKAAVTFPGWNDFIVLVDEGPYSIGAGATFYGKIHCNGGISNSGVVTGLATAGPGKSCTWSTSKAVNYPGGCLNNQDAVNFAALTNDLAAMKVSAQNAGAYYAASGQKGYNVILNGTSATIYKISKINTKASVAESLTPYGTLTQTALGTVAIPGDGVFFFDDYVWVSGNYGAKVTVASSKGIVVSQNLVQTVSGSNATCGLVCTEDILFPWWYDTMPDNQIVQAALLSQNGGVGPSDGTYGSDGTPGPSGAADFTAGGATLLKWTWTKTSNSPLPNGTWEWKSSTFTPTNKKSSVTLKGARAMRRMLGFSSGYDVRNFDKDPVLAANPPPLYPRLPGKQLGMSTWTEY